MSIQKTTFFHYIREFKLSELFIELGWYYARPSYLETVGEGIRERSSRC